MKSKAVFMRLWLLVSELQGSCSNNTLFRHLGDAFRLWFTLQPSFRLSEHMQRNLKEESLPLTPLFLSLYYVFCQCIHLFAVQGGVNYKR